MKSFKLFFLLGVVFLVPGCSKRTGGLVSYENETSLWGGTGFNPEAPAALARGLMYDDEIAAMDYTRSAQWTGTGFMGFNGNNSEEPFAERLAVEQQMLSENDLERKIVMTAHVRVRVENLNEADSLISDLMKKYGAYASSTSVEENSRNYSIRVPSTGYKAAIDELNGMGRLLGRTERAEDVTLRYYDLEGRLATKKELLKTFQSYLGKAKTIEEILSVEKRISELQYEIEGTGKELRNLADRVNYATIELSVLGPIASSPYSGPTLADRFRELFGSFGTFLSAAVIILVGIVIFGIPVMLLLIFFFWLLFGKIGLLKKLWRKAAGGKQKPV